jgi:hypothetical protein
MQPKGHHRAGDGDQKRGRGARSSDRDNGQAGSQRRTQQSDFASDKTFHAADAQLNDQRDQIDACPEEKSDPPSCLII